MFLLPAPVLIAWAAVKGGLGTVLGIWRAVPMPIRVCSYIALAFFVGHIYGRRAGDKACEARITKSIEDARTVDRKAARDAEMARAVEEQAQVSIEVATKRAIDEFREEVSKRGADNCITGPDLERFGVRDERVSGPASKPARRGQRHPDRSPVPAGEGKR